MHSRHDYVSYTYRISVVEQPNKICIMINQLTCRCGWGKFCGVPPLEEELQAINRFWESQNQFSLETSSLIVDLIPNYQSQTYVFMSTIKWTQCTRINQSIYQSIFPSFYLPITKNMFLKKIWSFWWLHFWLTVFLDTVFMHFSTFGIRHLRVIRHRRSKLVLYCFCWFLENFAYATPHVESLRLLLVASHYLILWKSELSGS